MKCWSGILSKNELGGLEYLMGKWNYFWYQCHLLFFSHSLMSDTLWSCGLQHTGFSVIHHLLELAQTHVHWVNDSIQPSRPLSSPSPPALNLFPTSVSFLMSQLLASGGQSTGASASTSVLPMNIKDWFPLGLTGLISLLSNGLSRVFSNTTMQKHQFFGSQPPLQFNSHIHTWLLEKP